MQRKCNAVKQAIEAPEERRGEESGGGEGGRRKKEEKEGVLYEVKSTVATDSIGKRETKIIQYG